MTKNTLFFSATLALFAIGCNGDDEPGKDTAGDSGAPVGDDDDDDGPVATNEFDDATLASGVLCSGTTVDFSFDFIGDAAEGMIDAADTANASNWNDFHILDAGGFTEFEAYTLLSATGITTGADPANWADGVSTVFTCDGHYNSSVMTYAVRAYDLDGNLADCVAWGEDVDGFLAGDFFNANDVEAPTELTGCRTAAAAR